MSGHDVNGHLHGGDGRYQTKPRAEAAAGVVLDAPARGEGVETPVSDLRVGDWVRLSPGGGGLARITSLDNDHKSTSIEFDHDPMTIADYGNDETLARLSLLDVHDLGETGYYTPNEAELGEAAWSYEKTLAWSSVVVVGPDSEGEGEGEGEMVGADSLDAEFSTAAKATIREDVHDFLSSNKALIDEAGRIMPGYNLDQAMHDFALTRNGHGAGFWDRGLGEVGDRLTEAAKAHGGQDLWFDATSGTLGIE